MSRLTYQQANFDALRESLRKGSLEEIREALDAREAGEAKSVMEGDECAACARM